MATEDDDLNPSKRRYYQRRREEKEISNNKRARLLEGGGISRQEGAVDRAWKRMERKTNPNRQQIEEEQED